MTPKKCYFLYGEMHRRNKKTGGRYIDVSLVYSTNETLYLFIYAIPDYCRRLL